MPQSDGSFVWMTEAELKNLERQTVTRNRKDAIAKYYLYTNTNPNNPQLIDPANSASLSNSNFNKDKPTRIIIHGWKNHYQSKVNVILRSALLETGSYNVICVDWNSKAKNMYVFSMLDVPEVGEEVANFIDFLNQQGGMPFNTLLVIGHSLGAHVSGFAGKNVKNGKISQITGLDPAWPGFSYNKPYGRLCETDAVYVESIQTCGGYLGFIEPIGMAAFYPNGGKSQPGCGLDLGGSCAHSRSYQYYGEAIRKNDFPSIKCSNYKQAVEKSCGITYSSIRMGAPSNAITAFGQFYVRVRSESPFGMG